MEQLICGSNKGDTVKLEFKIAATHVAITRSPGQASLASVYLESLDRQNDSPFDNTLTTTTCKTL